MNIGIIGQGFVGSAIREGLRDFYSLLTFDISKSEDFDAGSLRALVESSDIIFQCLPTPMKKSGKCDISIVESCLSDINKLCIDVQSPIKKIVVIKSTVPPGTTRYLDKKFENIDIIFSPEFLTEANASSDFKNQTRIILGGTRPATTIVKTMFKKIFPSIPIVKTGSNTAEMVKYFINCFLATKVSFANEVKQICDESNVDFDKVVEYALYDDRLGRTHFSVPGPDGSYGFSGSCFPKDLRSLMYIASSLDIDAKVMSGVWDKNLEVRPEKDWELLKGRAVSDD
jgi:nucleotide sugar dehydrogenase